VLQKLEKLDVDSEEFTRLRTELRDAVLDHANHEENDEFARLGGELSNRELDSMGRAAKLAEAIAPTWPHAGVEFQLANLVAGPSRQCWTGLATPSSARVSPSFGRVRRGIPRA
jgi:hypothetical protein